MVIGRGCKKFEHSCVHTRTCPWSLGPWVLLINGCARTSPPRKVHPQPPQHHPAVPSWFQQLPAAAGPGSSSPRACPMGRGILGGGPGTAAAAAPWQQKRQQHPGQHPSRSQQHPAGGWREVPSSPRAASSSPTSRITEETSSPSARPYSSHCKCNTEKSGPVPEHTLALANQSDLATQLNHAHHLIDRSFLHPRTLPLKSSCINFQLSHAHHLAASRPSPSHPLPLPLPLQHMQAGQFRPPSLSKSFGCVGCLSRN